MSYSKNTLAGGGGWEIHEAAGFFRLLSTTGVVKVSFFRNGSLVSEVENVSGGFWRRGPIDRVIILDQSAASNTVEVMQDVQEVGYDRSAGSVSVTGQVLVANDDFAFGQTQSTVTTTAANLLAANASRRYLMIQNKSATGNIFVNFAGTATVANGFLIPAGGVWEWNGSQSNQAVSAIGNIASNPDVIVIWA